jgi:hypothetical protein
MSVEGGVKEVKGWALPLPLSEEDDRGLGVGGDEGEMFWGNGEKDASGERGVLSFQFQSTVSAYVRMGGTPSSRETRIRGMASEEGILIGIDGSCVAE